MSSSIYLVLDMINDLVHADGPSAKGPYGVEVRERGIVPRTAVAVARARAAGVRIGFVRIGFSPDYRECPPKSPIFSRAPKAGLFKLGTWGTEVHPDLAPQPGDFDFIKHRVSPFHGTTLDLMLRTHGIERIYCSGISTNAVVQALVREGHDRDYEIVVLEDCCCALSSQEHAAAVDGLQRFGSFVDSGSMVFA
jgi:nicotinamidase-related amidase